MHGQSSQLAGSKCCKTEIYHAPYATVLFGYVNDVNDTNLQASVIAALYWLLKESISKATVDGKYVAKLTI